MKKKNTWLYSLLFLGLVLFVTFFFTMPPTYNASEKTPLSEFSTKRALLTVKEISKKPHYVGSKNHESVANYLQKKLEELGLKTTIQEGFTMTEKGVLVKSKNIIATVKGTENNSSLLLLSHYDSAPHSFSKGAGDDASGIATILEGVRAFLHKKTPHKNDLIILFTDAEELGLNGAALFVTEHKLAKKIGLALNFEARGTSGPSYMLMETTNGNAKMVAAFKKANTKYPVSNSLMYSIYKLLPNDTDLTVFREKGAIQGFNFAFIDSHFNYHTSEDRYENLNPNSLQHQGSYLIPLLNYFSNTDLTTLKSTDNKIYFNTPLGFVSYSFLWNLPLLILLLLLLLLFVFIGLGKRLLQVNELFKGGARLLGTLVIAGSISYFLWKFIAYIYPQYNEILHGFTYNGNDYLIAFCSLTLALCFLVYQNNGKRNPEMNQLVASLLIWIIINIWIVTSLEGAGFLIIPVIASTIMLGVYVTTQKSSWVINGLLAIPSLVILVPLIQMFPIGLGLKIIYLSSIIIVLTFTLLLPIFGAFPQKKIWSMLFGLVFLFYTAKAHFSSAFDNEKAKPNSLIYILNNDSKSANWATYDTTLDEWTKSYLGNTPKTASDNNVLQFSSKYGSNITFTSKAPVIKIKTPSVAFLVNKIENGKHKYKIKITPNRVVNRYDIYLNNRTKIINLKANGVTPIAFKSKIASVSNSKLLIYYVVDNVPLELEFSTLNSQKLDMELVESSFDLMSNPLLKVKQRKSWMISKPFVLNDAVIVKQKIKDSPIVKEDEEGSKKEKKGKKEKESKKERKESRKEKEEGEPKKEKESKNERKESRKEKEESKKEKKGEKESKKEKKKEITKKIKPKKDSLNVKIDSVR